MILLFFLINYGITATPSIGITSIATAFGPPPNFLMEITPLFPNMKQNSHQPVAFSKDVTGYGKTDHFAHNMIFQYKRC